MAEQSSQAQPIFALKVLAGNSLAKGTEITLTSDRVVLGNDPEKAAVVLPNDIKISAQHCVLQRDGDEFTLYDADSVSGTFVNGEELHRGHHLVPGDRIQVGDTVVSYTKRRVWTQEAKSLREMLPDLVAILIVMAIAAAVLLTIKGPEEPNILALVTTEETDLPPGEERLAKWDTSEFRKWEKKDFKEAPTKESSQESARRHYRRGKRCYDERALDPSNAFTAILELRRAKAYNYFCGKEYGEEPLAMDADVIQNMINACREYLKKQLVLCDDGWTKSLAIGDYNEAARYARRVMAMFSGKYKGEKTLEYAEGEKRLSRLGLHSIESGRQAAGAAW
jgi:pSer/pThr/pTyr-binding forkhead associated (FHA) protein